MDKQCIKFQLFKKIEVAYNSEPYDISDFLGKQLINLLEVLLLYPNHEVSKDDLIKMLWPHSENPQNVMKFTVFRLRKDLKRIPALKDFDLIVTTKKGYALSSQYDYDIDVEQFLDTWELIKTREKLLRQDVAKVKRMMDIYRGKIYATTTQPEWVENRSEELKNIYTTGVMMLCQYYMEKQEYQKMLKLNYKAILAEPFYEGLHYYYMQGLIQLKDYHKALQYYDEMNEAFYRELGTGPSPRLKELYDMISREDERKIKIDIQQLQEDLKEGTTKQGGFYCSYAMFKYIREILVKTALRDHKKYYLVLFELQSVQTDSKVDKETIMMNRFKYLIMNSIRKNDVFTKVNDSQFALLLGCNSEEDVQVVIRRITSSFYKKFASHKYRISYSVLETTESGEAA